MVKELQPTGDKMKKVLCWVSEAIQNNPAKKRQNVFQDAEIRFDLSPRECDFLNKQFAAK
jgi:hypothetical protein